jgi:CDP-glucose 4,6-dehydratase
LEGLVMYCDAFTNTKVWLSGHTGFKGAWLAEWLLKLGARVHGFALPPPTSPSLFDQLGLAQRLEHELGDVRDLDGVRRSLHAANPDYVFHLAAQPLVREAYAHPVETYAINAQGTVHVLEALRAIPHPCAAVFITTDKCYENREWVYGYREEDPLGGYDPYSSSKAAAELVIQAYRRSFFQNHPVRIASARAGNVIGGGDWAADRIVPDCIRHLQRQRVIAVRNPGATRPWQHVLEPLSGYLWLAAALAGRGSQYLQQCPPCSAFNFGPGPEANRSVAELVSELLKHWPGRWEDARDPHAVHEAGLLQLCVDKARSQLKWSPVWTFEEAMSQTAGWYRRAQTLADPAAVRVLTHSQIDAYCARAREKHAVWTQAEPAAVPAMTETQTETFSPEAKEKQVVWSAE